MNAQFAFLLSIGASLLSYAMLASWYIVPHLLNRPRLEALLPLVLLHTFRVAGLVFLLPQVMGGALPADFAVTATYGDLLTAVLAFLTAFALRLRPGLALPLVWLFNLVGTADLLFAMYEGNAIGLPFLHIGVAWFIVTLYVPLLLVSHVLVFWLLLRAAPSSRVDSGQAAPGESGADLRHARF